LASVLENDHDDARPLSELEVDRGKDEEEGGVQHETTITATMTTRRLGAIATLLCLLKINAISLFSLVAK